MKNIKIILADSNFNHAQNINEILTKQGYADVLMVDNYSMLMQQLKTFESIELLIIDSSLAELKLINFLTEIVSFRPIIKTMILSTDITNQAFTKHFYRSGVDYIINRSVSSEEFISILSILFDKYFTYISNLNFSLDKTREIRSNSKQAIDQIRIKRDLLGYQYLVTAVELVFKDYKLGQAASKGLYPEIALHHQTNSTRVERSIRYAIKNAVKDCGQKVIAKALKITPRSSKRISNMELIFSLVEILKN